MFMKVCYAPVCARVGRGNKRAILVGTQCLRSPWPAVGKQATLENFNLKSENIGPLAELGMSSSQVQTQRTPWCFTFAHCYWFLSQSKLILQRESLRQAYGVRNEDSVEPTRKSIHKLSPSGRSKQNKTKQNKTKNGFELFTRSQFLKCFRCKPHEVYHV